ncbi:MAG: heat-inducible transcription repressor HrcA [Acidobacteriota bacterium]
MDEALSEREREVLCEVVELYLGCGEPVASRSVAEASELSLSPASIRAIMAQLEEKGLLHQPHTSAGRVPSDMGLAVYLERILRQPALPANERERLCRLLPAGGTLEGRLDHASRVLAQLANQVGMAVRPVASTAPMRSLHFVKVDDSQVLAVLVTGGGVVESRVLAVGRCFEDDELTRISRFCTETFAGLTLKEIRDRLAVIVEQERTRYDELVAAAVELTNMATREAPLSSSSVFVQGVENLLAGGEAHRESLQRVLVTLSERTALMHLLDRFLASPGPYVAVGGELAFLGAPSLGMVIRSFRLGGGEVGLVGVIGVRHMNYPYLVPVVDFVGQRLAGQGGGP